jgi:hypothetical protein
LSHLPQPPPSIRYFLNKVSGLCQGQPGPKSSYLYIPHSWDDRAHSHAHWDGVTRTFCQGWPWTAIHPISASRELRLQAWAWQRSLGSITYFIPPFKSQAISSLIRKSKKVAPDYKTGNKWQNHGSNQSGFIAHATAGVP